MSEPLSKHHVVPGKEECLIISLIESSFSISRTLFNIISPVSSSTTAATPHHLCIILVDSYGSIVTV